ncbi:MAG: LytTR family DNA-binding domain-containing protein [Bacteroidota bacterium]
MIKILIVDDEASAGNILEVLIKKYITAETEIVYCDNVKDGLQLIQTFNPSLIMLDIDMPVMNGFDLLSMTPENNFDVIFTTAHDHYAIKAIRFSALDYLLKPIDVFELQTAINKHIERQKNSNRPLLINNLIHNLHQSNSSEFKLALSTTKGVFFYAPSEILYCEGENNYTQFIFSKHKPVMISKTLGEFEDLLEEYGFLRIHKSYLVNKNFVTSVNRDGDVIMADGKALPISRRRKDGIMNSLKGVKTTG